MRYEGDGFVCETRPIRRRDRASMPFFERDWPDFLTGAIHDPLSLMSTEADARARFTGAGAFSLPFDIPTPSLRAEGEAIHGA